MKVLPSEKKRKDFYGEYFTMPTLRGNFLFFCDRHMFTCYCRLIHHRFGCITSTEDGGVFTLFHLNVLFYVYVYFYMEVE